MILREKDGKFEYSFNLEELAVRFTVEMLMAKKDIPGYNGRLGFIISDDGILKAKDPSDKTVSWWYKPEERKWIAIYSVVEK